MSESVPDDSAQAAGARTSRGRTVASVLCVVVATMLTSPAVVAYWGQRTLNDTQRYVQTVQPLVESPVVQAAVATKVTDAIEKQVDVEAMLKQVFAGVITDRPRLQALVGPMAGAVNSLIEAQVREFIASDAFADLWVTINTKAQQTLVRVLRGDESGAVSVQGDQVVLDLTEVIEQVKTRLVGRGLTIVENVPVPDTDRQIVLLDAPELKQAQTIYAFANPIARWLILLVAVLFLAAYLLARNRPRMAVVIGLTAAANALLMALLLAIGRQLFVNHLAGTVFGPASRIFYDTLLSYLERSQKVLFLLGAVLVVMGWFAGRNASGTAVRDTSAAGLQAVGAALADTPPVATAGKWVAANIRWLRGAAAVVGVIVLLWGNDISPPRFFWSLAVVVVLLSALQILNGAGQATGQADTTTPASPEAEAAANT